MKNYFSMKAFIKLLSVIWLPLMFSCKVEKVTYGGYFGSFHSIFTL